MFSSDVSSAYFALNDETAFRQSSLVGIPIYLQLTSDGYTRTNEQSFDIGAAEKPESAPLIEAPREPI